MGKDTTKTKQPANRDQYGLTDKGRAAMDKKEYNVNVDSVRRWVREEELQAQVQGRANKRPPKRPANLLGPDFHPVEIDKKSLPLQGPALRLPEEQQRKVGRLLAIYQMR